MISRTLITIEMIAITASAIVADLYASQSCLGGPHSTGDSMPFNTIRSVHKIQDLQSYNLCSYETTWHVLVKNTNIQWPLAVPAFLHIMTDYVYTECFCPSLEVCAIARTVLVKMSNIAGMYNSSFCLEEMFTTLPITNCWYLRHWNLNRTICCCTCWWQYTRTSNFCSPYLHWCREKLLVWHGHWPSLSIDTTALDYLLLSSVFYFQDDSSTALELFVDFSVRLQQ